MKINSLKNKRVLITCGPTWVPIDPMRIISNRSTGELGQLLALELTAQKAKVTLVEGPVENSLANAKIKKIKYHFFSELEEVLKTQLKRHDAVIHAAAVSDFQLKKPFKAKISSSKTLKLELTQTKKLIDHIKKINPNIFLVGFKLESKLSKKSLATLALDLYNTARCDLIVANTATSKKYDGHILLPNGKTIDRANSRPAMAKKLTNILEQLI